MARDEKREMTRKIAITIIEVIAIIAVLWFLIAASENVVFSDAKADDFYEIRYVICKDYVNARSTPNKKQEPIGRLETGDVVYTDGVKKNGYLHCVGMGFEATEGWVFGGFLIEEKPEKMWKNATIVSNGRLAARKYVGGKRTRWLKSGATVKVYYWSDSWSLTNCGYVQTQYLELDGE